MVHTAVMTSRFPPSMQLLGKFGLYSQIAVVVSMVAIFMIWPMTATFDRLTTWLRHLKGADEQITCQ